MGGGSSNEAGGIVGQALGGLEKKIKQVQPAPVEPPPLPEVEDTSGAANKALQQEAKDRPGRRQTILTKRRETKRRGSLTGRLSETGIT